jgi:hypothetical protein
MSKRILRINDKVCYTQLELFDNSLLDKQGTVVKINRADREGTATAAVLFDRLGLFEVPIGCLTKIQHT